MVLVDTSVWIRFLTNRAPYKAELDRLLDRNEVTGHDLVYGELMIGDRGGRAMLLETYARMPQTRMISHDEVVRFVRDRDLHGRGVGWIEVHLLASALVARTHLWTADPRFSAMASEFGVAYAIPDSGRR